MNCYGDALSKEQANGSLNKFIPNRISLNICFVIKVILAMFFILRYIVKSNNSRAKASLMNLNYCF